MTATPTTSLDEISLALAKLIADKLDMDVASI